jgi:hypothetical protein
VKWSDALTPAEVRGKVLIVERGEASLRRLDALQPALVIVLVRQLSGDRTRAQLRDPERQGLPRVLVRSEALQKLYGGLAAGAVTSVRVGAPKISPAPVKNVAGVLRGSDAALRETYVLVTAHYDHVGLKSEGDGDRVFNGANDDASGVAAVIALAQEMAAGPRPKRTIVFMTYFGEELGLLGSRYYVRHPLFPLERTVANVNLEQLGRTEAEEGAAEKSFTLTGFSFSTVSRVLQKAGESTGVRVYDNEKYGDAFFNRSDNQALADAGVPAHTIAVAFGFPDYHQVSDEWPKMNYDNMALVTRTLALGVRALAEDPQEPAWNPENPKTKKYREAREQRTMNTLGDRQ